MNEKNWGVTDHRACLGDIVQNIARMGVFFLIFQGYPGQLLQKLA